VSIAVPATVVALVIYWIVLMPNLRFLFIESEPWIKLVLALVGMGLAIYFFVRWRTWPALLFLVGSVPVVLFNISMCGWMWRMEHGGTEPGSFPVLAFLFPSDTNSDYSVMNPILHYIGFLTLCLPVAFFWYLFRVIDRHLTKRWSEPPTGEKTSA